MKNFCQMVLVFFLALKTGTGLSCTFYKILVNFSLSLNMKPGTVRLSRVLTLKGCHFGLECTKEPGVWVNGIGGREVIKVEELSSPPKLSLTP